MGDFVSYGQMLLPMLYHLSDVIAFINVVVVGKTLRHLCDLLMADVIAKWQDETATFLCFKVGRCTLKGGGYITDKNGKILFEQEEIDKRWVEYIKELYDDD